MEKAIVINGHEIPLKEYKGQRVVTFKEIDQVHGRNEGTAKKRFYDNRRRFIEGTDYFSVSSSEIRTSNLMSVFRTLEIPNRGLILVTETGYLMLVKSFTDDLAWQVQRELVNGYFKVKQAVPVSKGVPATVDSIQKEVDAVKELLKVYQKYDNEKYLYPLRSSAWLLAAQILTQLYDLGKVV